MATTEADRKENTKWISLYMGIVVGVVAGYAFAYAGGLVSSRGVGLLDAFGLAFSMIKGWHIIPPLNAGALIGFLCGGCLAGVLTWFVVSTDSEKNYHYKADEVAGTGRFMNRKELADYTAKYIKKDPVPIETNLPVRYDPEHDAEMYSKNMIMSAHFMRPINDQELIGNNSVLLVGASGTGKSRFFIKPNILQMNASYVITDPSGEMIYSLGKVLRDHGYKIKIFNISDMEHSNRYNPLQYIRDAAGVKMVIECLINNTTKGSSSGDNQFFVDAEQLLYSACIFYLKDFCYNKSEVNFPSVMEMINASSVNELDPNAKSKLDELFEGLPHSSLAWKFYRAFKQAAGKTLKSIIISCVTRLQPFLIPQVINLTRTDELEIEKLGYEKTALFIITPQADRTYSFLASMLYSQIFETSYYIGEQQRLKTGSERLPIPIRCMMDEFCNIGEVPEFPSKLATMRKYNISATVAIQNNAQIEAMYEDEWKSLVGNCSTIVFLGSNESEVLEYYSEKLGKMTIRTKSESVSNGTNGSSNQSYQPNGREVMTADELGRLPSDECIIYTQNMRPVRDKKYDYTEHPYFPQTADSDKNLGFEYQKISVYNTKKTGFTESIITAKAEIARYREKKDFRRFPIDPAKVRLRGNESDIMNSSSLGEGEDRKAYSRFVSQAVVQAAGCSQDEASIIRLEGLPTKFLPPLVRQVSAQLKRSPVICFSSLDSGNGLIVGAGTGQDVDGLMEAMQNQFACKVSMVNGIIVTAVKDSTFDEYRQEVNAAMRARKASTA